MERRIQVISEPAYVATHWHADTLAGIREYAAQRGWQLDCRAPEADACQLEELGILPDSAVILLGTSMAWDDALCAYLQSAGARVLTIGEADSRAGYSVSSIFLDCRAAMEQVVRYLRYHGRSHLALLGINPVSVTDREKAQGFGDAGAIYSNAGDLTRCVEEFLEREQDCDAVICSNDVVALELLRRLRMSDRSDPLTMFIASFGNTLLGELTAPSLTSVTLDYREVGRQAVRLWSLLSGSRLTMSLRCRVGCRIIPRGTTLHMAPPPDCPAPLPARPVGEDNLFYRDNCVRETLRLEKLVSLMDITDCHILLGVLGAKTYEALAEELHMSDGTVKYRLKRMVRFAESQSREELLELVRRRGAGVIEGLASLKGGK